MRPSGVSTDELVQRWDDWCLAERGAPWRCKAPPGEYGSGRHRFGGWVEAAKVDIQLAVREPVAHLKRPVHGKAGFSDTCGAVDGREQDDTLGRCRVEQRGERILFRRAVGEMSGRGTLDSSATA
jgi:hypothetical protein